MTAGTKPPAFGRGWNLGWNFGRSKADYKLLAATGAKLVRFGVMLTTDGVTYQLSDESLVELDRNVACAKARGLRIVVAVFMDPWLLPDDPLWTTASLQASLVDIWTSLAQRLKPARHVTVDPLNEPFSDVWRPLFCRLVEAIRKVDPNRKIVATYAPVPFPQTTWTGAFDAAQPYPYKGLIYGVHMYEPLSYTQQGVEPWAPNRADFEPTAARDALAPIRAFQLKHQVQIYVGEFSAARWAPGRLEYLQELLSLFEEYGWAWTYHGWREWHGWDAEMNSDPDDMTRRADEPAHLALLAALKG